MSSDEEEFSINRKKRGCPRIRIEEEEEGDSSSTGDSVVGNERRKKCCVIESDESEDSDPELEDSGVNMRSENEGESSEEDNDDCDNDDEDSDNWEDINEDSNQGAAESDASDGQSEKCAICLNRFLGQEIGVPESCDHPFCLECLLEWTKKMNTCPVDRLIFNLVLIKLELDGKVVRRVPVASPEDLKSDEDETLTYCEVCARCDREDRLLLCDSCDLGYHCECLDPPLDAIPIEEWYCPNCTPPPSSGEEEMPEDLLDELNELLQTRFRPQTMRRAIARTRASETVRSRIQRRRTAAGAAGDAQTDQIIARTRVKRKTARRKRRTKKKTKRKKKTGSSAKSISGVSSKTKTRRRRRKRKSYRKRKGRTIGRTRRAIQAARPLVCPTVKKRIAERLGLQKPPPGHTMPLMRQLGPTRTYVPDTGLLLFGDRDELHSFESLYEEENDNGEVSALRAIPAHRHAPHKSKEIRTRISVPYSSSSSSFDLLGSILETQSLLHTNSVNVKIGRDGTLSSSENKTLQCPLGPSSASSDPEPDPDHHNHAKSHTQSPTSTHCTSTEAMTYSSTNSNIGECADATESVHHNDDHCNPSSDYHRRQQRSPKHHQNKETTNKPPASDDDIDIYSDIESISNDTMDDMYGVDSMTVDRCEPASPMDQHHVADSSEDELIIDEEAPHPESEQEDSATPSKNGLKSPEETFEEYDDDDDDDDDVGERVESDSMAARDTEEIDVCGLEIDDMKNETPYDDDDDDDDEEDSRDVCTDTQEDPASPDALETASVTKIEEDNLESDINEVEPDNKENHSEESRSEIHHVKSESISSERDDIDSDDPNVGSEKLESETFTSKIGLDATIEEDEPEDHSMGKEKLEPEIDQSKIDLDSTIEEEPEDPPISKGTAVNMGHDEDDVISAKVGSPISESEEHIHNYALRKDLHVAKQEQEPAAEAEEEEEEDDEDAENNQEEPPEEGEVAEDEIEEGEDKTESVHCYGKLEGVEDVSEAGSEDNQLDDDKEEGRGEESCSRELAQDGEMDDIEAKVAQLMGEESKQEQSEEEEGLCESEHGNSQDATEVTVQKTLSSHHHHHHPAVESSSSKSLHRSSREHVVDSGKRSEPEISWKRLSKNTKERSYRDGKQRDERILYRERELKDKGMDERTSRRKEEGGCRHTRKDEERNSSRYEKRNSSGSSNKNKYKEYKENKYESSSGGAAGHSKRHRNDYEWHDKKWAYEKHSGGEKRTTDRHKGSGEKVTTTASSSSSKHKHKYDQYGSKYDDTEKHYKHEQPLPQITEEVKTNKHRREKRKEREVRKVENKIIVKKKSGKEKKRMTSSQPKKKKRTPSPVSEVSDVESKEIYSKGGSIIINVNYNRSTNKENSSTKQQQQSKLKQPLPPPPPKKSVGVTKPVVVHDSDSDSWAAADSKEKSTWDDDDDDEIQIVCEKPAAPKGKHHRPASPPPVTVAPKRKKETREEPKPVAKVNTFDMFWRDVEDISQDGKTEQGQEEMDQSKNKECISGDGEDVQEERILQSKGEKESKKPSPPQGEKQMPNDNLTFSGIFKKQPRSPSPPSPSDDESYDPCRPTSSPVSPKKDTKEVITSSSEPPISNPPKPPPEPVLPPLPPEPEPRQPSPPPLKATYENSPSINPIGMQQHPQQSHIAFVNTPPSTQFSGNSNLIQSAPMPMPNIRIPPPNFIPPAMGRNPGGLVTTLRPWTMANGPPHMFLQSSPMQHVIRGNFMGPGGLQASQIGGMMPPHGGNHLQMLRPPLGGPGLLPTPSRNAGSSMQHMLLPDLSHPPPPLVLQTQPSFSVGTSIVSNSTTVVTSVPLLVPLMTMTHQTCPSKPETVKEGSDTVIDMDVESPYSPIDSPGADDGADFSPEVSEKRPSTPPKEKDRFDALLEAVPRLLADKTTRELLTVLRPKISGVKNSSEKKSSVAAATSTTVAKADSRTKRRHKTLNKRKGIAVKMKESQLKILDELPSSAVEMQVKEKFLKKLNRQERVVEEVKHALKPFYNKRDIDKSEYKAILRKCVPKICHNKTGEINPVKIKGMVESYVRKYKHHKKKNQKGDS